jgi:hypothetical protein
MRVLRKELENEDLANSVFQIALTNKPFVLPDIFLDRENIEYCRSIEAEKAFTHRSYRQAH